MTVARWRHKSAEVPLASIAVFHAGLSGFDVQLGSEVLWVESQAHFDDLIEAVRRAFAVLPERRGVPARTDGVKPTYLNPAMFGAADVSGSCYQSEEE